MAKLGYFVEFLLFPPLILLPTTLAFRSASPPDPVSWTLVYGIGIAGWTLLEYVLHRIFFHHAPFLSRLHEQHHEDPHGLIGAPAWTSVSFGLFGVFGPSWALLGFGLATAVTAGMATGYLWYVFVHYATHHWQPRRGSYLHRVQVRHLRHHHVSDSCNFGVTTGVWDAIFGTALRRRRVAGSG